MVQFITGTRSMGTEMFTVMLPTLGFIAIYVFLIPTGIASLVMFAGVCFGLNELCKHRKQKANGKWEWCKERQGHNMWNIGGKIIK